MVTRALDMVDERGPSPAEMPRASTNVDPLVRSCARSSATALTCRQMAETDIEAAVDLLRQGFPERNASYWRFALARLRERAVPEGRPRYGYVMSNGGRLVGLVLVIFSKTDLGTVRGNVSSWYVDPAYRGLSHMLLSAALRLKGVTLFNVSPAPSTHQTIAAQGFTRYVHGMFLAFAALARPVRGATVRRVSAGSAGDGILVDHAGWGCLCFEVSVGGETYPFVFVRHHLFGGRIPCAQLVYCRDVADFACFANPLGRRLLRHGLAVVAVDADRPLGGVPGFFRPGRGPKFYRGGTPPRLGDLSYTELAIFGA